MRDFKEKIIDNNNSSKSKHIEYKNCITNDTVYIHPSSFVWGQVNEWVVYKELVETNQSKKIYMKGVTAIHPSWLPSLGTSLCKLSAPLEVPEPRYDDKEDKMYCFVKPSYGLNYKQQQQLQQQQQPRWELPIQEVEFPDVVEKYKYFARFLLEGKIVTEFNIIRPYLSGKPNFLTSKVSTQHKVFVLLQPIVNAKISSRKQLLKKWESDPQFLHKELTLWLQPQHHHFLTDLFNNRPHI